MTAPTVDYKDMAAAAQFPRIVVALAADYVLLPADSGKVFDAQATLNLDVPVGLPPNFFCVVIGNKSGVTVSVRSVGAVALLNGATTTLTRAAATAGNGLWSIQKRVAVDDFAVTGA